MLLYSWLQNIVNAKGGVKALIYRDTYLSWRGLIHRVDRRAEELQAAGVRKGDWVGLMLGNVPDVLILSLSLSKLQACAIPLDPTLSTRELEFIMSVAPMRGLITRPRGGDAPLPAASATNLSGHGPKQAAESRRRLQGTLLSCSIYPVDARNDVSDGETATALVFIASDTQGNPKPVLRTQRNLLAETHSIIANFKLTPEDHILVTVPLFQSYGFDYGFLAPLRIGSVIYLEDELAANRIIKLVREQHISFLPGTPDLYETLSKLPASRPLSHKPVRFVSRGGGLSGNSADHFYKKYGLYPLSCFETTETGTISIDLKGQHGDSMGKPISDVEIQITPSDKLSAVGASKRGVLWVRGQSISENRESSVVASEDGAKVGFLEPTSPSGGGWYRTGDLVSLERGRLYLKGRDDDLVLVDGKKIALGEIETCLKSHPKVIDAKAMICMDSLTGVMLVGKVILKSKTALSQEAILDYCAHHLSPYKVPRRIEFCTTLSQMGNGNKVDNETPS